MLKNCHQNDVCSWQYAYGDQRQLKTVGKVKLSGNLANIEKCPLQPEKGNIFLNFFKKKKSI